MAFCRGGSSNSGRALSPRYEEELARVNDLIVAAKREPLPESDGRAWPPIPPVLPYR